MLRPVACEMGLKLGFLRLLTKELCTFDEIEQRWPHGTRWTFDEIERKWQNGTQGQRRHLWEQLTGPECGWFKACRYAVKTFDDSTLQAWLNPQDDVKRAIMDFALTRAAAMVRSHLQSEERLTDNEKQTIIRFHCEETAKLLRAHLRCAEVAIVVIGRVHWPTQTNPGE
jgi:hypothetical protein